jgi:cell wall assembly regulator SMI1
MDTKTRITALVERISQQLTELDRLSEVESSSELGPPASPERVSDFELRVGFDLPEDYRAFLLLHDGWKDFNGESALLSIGDMTSGKLFETIRDYQKELQRVGQHGPGQGLVIEGSFGTRIAYFDRLGHRDTAKLDVVYWDRGPIARYADFSAFLEGYSKDLAQMIDDERTKLR